MLLFGVACWYIIWLKSLQVVWSEFEIVKWIYSAKDLEESTFAYYKIIHTSIFEAIEWCLETLLLKNVFKLSQVKNKIKTNFSNLDVWMEVSITDLKRQSKINLIANINFPISNSICLNRSSIFHFFYVVDK